MLPFHILRIFLIFKNIFKFASIDKLLELEQEIFNVYYFLRQPYIHISKANSNINNLFILLALIKVSSTTRTYTHM